MQGHFFLTQTLGLTPSFLLRLQQYSHLSCVIGFSLCTGASPLTYKHAVIFSHAVILHLL